MNDCQAPYPPIPGLQPVMSITALLADAETLGNCVEGYRVNYPIIGGHFAGPQLKGTVQLFLGWQHSGFPFNDAERERC